MATIAGIKQVDLTKIDESTFKQQNTGCIVLTHNNRILLQRRPENWRTFPAMIATFGGHCEAQYFDNVANALVHPKLMDDVRWALTECKNKQLIG